jgi:hypothetical protein
MAVKRKISTKGILLFVVTNNFLLLGRICFFLDEFASSWTNLLLLGRICYFLQEFATSCIDISAFCFFLRCFATSCIGLAASKPLTLFNQDILS